MFRSLDPAKLLETIKFFRRRIDLAFPGSGLSSVGTELEETAQLCFVEAERHRQPLWWLRALVACGVLGLLTAPAEALVLFHFPVRFNSLGELLSAADAGFNVVLLIAGAALFLVSMENRVKRRRALRVLHQLRSLAHVIDMHQLNKDPGMSAGAMNGEPPSDLSKETIRQPEDLWNYLSFCSDLLAVTGKLAACFAHQQPDRIVLDTVNEIENLSTELSQKIWQKMSFLKPPRPVSRLPEPDAMP